MKRLTVMHILNTGSYSGAENVAISLIKKLSKRVDGVYVSPNGSIREVVEKSGIRHYAVEQVNVKNIRKAIRDIQPDIIHAHDRTASMVAAMSTFRIPVISHLHNNTPWMKKLCPGTVLYGLSCMHYSRILTVSDSVMDEYVFGRLVKPKTIVLGNPVLVRDIRRKAEKADQKTAYHIVFLGRFSPQKNPHMFLRIVRRCREEYPDLRAVMIGRGEMEVEIHREIAAKGLSGCIDCLGFVSNPYGILQASGVLCIPSSYEGFGLAAVESLAVGTPVVASAVGGLPGIVDDTCGRICCSPDEYAKEILRLLTDKDYYEGKTNGAFRKAAEMDNEHEFFEKIYRIYQMT